jgi:outer membrane protein assembly factor BamD (BamD/ComL family)
MYSDTSESFDAKRDSIYRILIHDFPESPYAKEARGILNLPQFIVTKDTVEALYSVAEEAITKNDFPEALTALKKIESVFDRSPLAPKALYTIGWLYENSLMRLDSASAVYRRLIQRYPQTPYALKVLPKITEEDQSKKEDEKKIESKDINAKETPGSEEKKDENKSSDNKPQ